MGKRKRKKKGSTMIVLLGMAMVMVMLSATLASALTFTTQNNEVEKRDDDLLYAAEGGLDYGIVEYNKRAGLSTALQNLSTGSQYPIETFNNFSSTVNKVEVKGFKKGDKEIQIISTATFGTKSRTVVKSINKVPSRQSLYEYSIVSNKVKITALGSNTVNDNRWGKIAYKNNFELEVWKYLSAPSNYGKVTSAYSIDSKNMNFAIGNVSPAKLRHTPEIDIYFNDIFGGNLGTKLEGLIGSPESNGSVAKRELIIPQPGGALSKRVKVYIVNTDKLNIYNKVNDPGRLENPFVRFDNTIIICPGKVLMMDIKDNYSQYRLNTKFSFMGISSMCSTIICQEYETYNNQNLGQYESKRPDEHGILHTDADVQLIDNVVREYIPTWNSVGTSTTDDVWEINNETVYK